MVGSGRVELVDGWVGVDVVEVEVVDVAAVAVVVLVVDGVLVVVVREVEVLVADVDVVVLLGGVARAKRSVAPGVPRPVTRS